MRAMTKTNAMRILDKAGAEYQIFQYESNGIALDGVTVAQKIGQPEERVYKTLVAQGSSRQYYVCVIPVTKELNLKLAARVLGEKSLEMIKVNQIQAVTGYVRGGCSPFGMKKVFPLFLDKSAELLDYIIVSAGKIGLQLALSPEWIIKLCDASYAHIC